MSLPNELAMASGWGDPGFGGRGNRLTRLFEIAEKQVRYSDRMGITSERPKQKESFMENGFTISTDKNK